MKPFQNQLSLFLVVYGGIQETKEHITTRKALLTYWLFPASHSRHTHTDIEKKTVATGLRFATSNTFRKQFYGYLLPNGYVERVSRGIYKITSKGEKLLEILN